MNTNEMDAVELQRQRRKRINRIKSAIVFILTFWIIASFLAIVILSVQVAVLNKKVNILEQAVSSGITGSSQNSENIDSSKDEKKENQTGNTERFANLELVLIRKKIWLQKQTAMTCILPLTVCRER